MTPRNSSTSTTILLLIVGLMIIVSSFVSANATSNLNDDLNAAHRDLIQLQLKLDTVLGSPYGTEPYHIYPYEEVYPEQAPEAWTYPEVEGDVN